MTTDVILQNVIISYPNLFEARRISAGGEPKFSASLIIPPDFDWSQVTAACEAALTAKFGATRPENLKYPWMDKFLATSVCKDDPYNGWVEMSSYADRQPQVVDAGVIPVSDPRVIFAGCRVHAYVRFYGFQNAGNVGVGCGLNAIQLVDNSDAMPRLDSVKSATEIFQPIAGAPAATAPAAGQIPVGAPGNQPVPGGPAAASPSSPGGPPGTMPGGAPDLS